MPTYKTIKVEKAIALDDLLRKPAPRVRERNPRDVELEKLVHEVAAGVTSQVTPWRYEPAKTATARLAINRAIKQTGLEVFASTRPDHPGVILLSRVPLSKRRGPRKGAP
jgi:hypothetical protein